MAKPNPCVTAFLRAVRLLISSWKNKIQLSNTLDIKEQVEIQHLSISKKIINVIKININDIIINKLFWLKFVQEIGMIVSSKSLNELINRLKLIKSKFNVIQNKKITKTD